MRESSVFVSSGGFEIEITSQGWLGEPKGSWDPARDDLCSHGDIRLVLGGRVIAAGDDTGDYTISTSALARPLGLRQGRSVQGGYVGGPWSPSPAVPLPSTAVSPWGTTRPGLR